MPAESPSITGPAPKTSDGASSLGTGQRLLEWLWRARAVDSALARVHSEPLYLTRYRAQAARAAELSRTAASTPTPARSGGPDAVALELARQSIYYCLLALDRTPPAEAPDFAYLLASIGQKRLLEAAGDRTTLDELLPLLRTSALIALVERAPEEQSRALRRLWDFGSALTRRLAAPEAALVRARFERWLRVGSILGSVVLLVVFVSYLRGVREDLLDLAHDKSWRASSSSINVCNSPRQYCDENPNFFFRTTLETDPWLELDLGALADFSRVKIVNRLDCCTDSGVPLTVEVSPNGSTWKPVAKQRAPFKTFEASFARQRARYVRVRAEGRKQLQLSSIRVLP